MDQSAGVEMTQAEVVVVIGIPDPEFPTVGGLVDATSGAEEFRLVKIDREGLRLTAFGGGKVSFAAEFLGEFLATVSPMLVLPLDEHGASFVADQAALFGGLGKVEFP